MFSIQFAYLLSQVRNLCNWSGDGRNHFRLKSRYTFEKLIRKVGYDAVYDAAPKEHRKFIVHTHKMAERKKRQRREEYEAYKVCSNYLVLCNIVLGVVQPCYY